VAERIEAELKEIARDLFDGALAECSVGRAFERKLRVVAEAESTRLEVEGGGSIALDRLRWVRIVAVGVVGAASAGFNLRSTRRIDCAETSGKSARGGSILRRWTSGTE